MLDEKHVLKRAAADLVPAAILRAAQAAVPRARRAVVRHRRGAGVDRRGGQPARPSREAGCFEPAAVAQLLAKCASRAAAGQFSNADNMGVVGVLSTQLVHHHFIRERYRATAPAYIRTLIDHASEQVSTP